MKKVVSWEEKLKMAGGSMDMNVGGRKRGEMSLEGILEKNLWEIKLVKRGCGMYGEVRDW